ncbi:MAG TPA: tetratricopeptide repeat protein, partial [Bacteroidales bacterium]|nr:tetratricopeptide repeat protein [Bacteroidales bacterium]
SSTTALEMFARADLNYFRNNKNAALMTLDSIIKIFSYHPITDDVYFKKAQIYMIMNNYKEADSLFSLILQNYSYDILADDALYNKALINEEIYKNKETAMELYQELLMKYPGSIYCIDARKRYRQLRGDIIN